MKKDGKGDEWVRLRHDYIIQISWYKKEAYDCIIVKLCSYDILSVQASTY